MKTIEETIFELREQIDKADAEQMRTTIEALKRAWRERRNTLTELLHWIMEK